MAVIGQVNWLGQQRVDVTHARLIESFIAGDFDALAGSMLSGGSPLVIQGFTINPAGIAGPAKNLTVAVAGAFMLHRNASEPGTLFSVPQGTPVEQLTNTNPNVSGSFTADSDNYVGIDLIRTVDDASQDLVQFLDANTDAETAQSVPLTRKLQYRFVISTRSFASSPNVAPLAIVHVDPSGVATSVTDARKMMFRLGSGGDVPNALSAYAFGTRTENAVISTSTALNPFVGEDKSIASLKGWLDAVMTRVWEVGGGEHWYSPTAERGVTMVRTGTTFANGDYFTWDGTYLQWKGIKFLFANSTATVNELADNAANVVVGQMGDGDAIYVDLDRSANHTVGLANQLSIAGGNIGRTALALVGSGAIPGSRYVIAWRVGSNVYTRGSSFPVGFALAAAGVALNTTGVLPTGNLGGVAVSSPGLATGTFTSSYPVAIGFAEKNVASGVAALDASRLVVGTGLGRDTLGDMLIAMGGFTQNLNMGGGSAVTAVQIGKTGITTTFPGAVSIAQTLGVTGTSTLGALSAGASTLSSVVSTSLDFSGVLSIGVANATSITIGRGAIRVGLPGGISLTNNGITFAGALSGVTTIGASGNVSAGSFTGPLTGNVTGNADTATLATTATNQSGGTVAATTATVSGNATGLNGSLAALDYASAGATNGGTLTVPSTGYSSALQGWSSGSIKGSSGMTIATGGITIPSGGVYLVTITVTVHSNSGWPNTVGLSLNPIGSQVDGVVADSEIIGRPGASGSVYTTDFAQTLSWTGIIVTTASRTVSAYIAQDNAAGATIPGLGMKTGVMSVVRLA